MINCHSNSGNVKSMQTVLSGGDDTIFVGQYEAFVDLIERKRRIVHWTCQPCRTRGMLLDRVLPKMVFLPWWRFFLYSPFTHMWSRNLLAKLWLRFCHPAPDHELVDMGEIGLRLSVYMMDEANLHWCSPVCCLLGPNGIDRGFSHILSFCWNIFGLPTKVSKWLIEQRKIPWLFSVYIGRTRIQWKVGGFFPWLNWWFGAGLAS